MKMFRSLVLFPDFTIQKDLILVQKAFNDLMKLNVQVILLGTGDQKYHAFFDKMATKNPKKFACYLGFNDELAHLIEAGSDMFLMPSKYEPCGLNQMYSLVLWNSSNC